MAQENEASAPAAVDAASKIGDNLVIANAALHQFNELETARVIHMALCKKPGCTANADTRKCQREMLDEATKAFRAAADQCDLLNAHFEREALGASKQ